MIRLILRHYEKISGLRENKQTHCCVAQPYNRHQMPVKTETEKCFALLYLALSAGVFGPVCGKVRLN